GHDLIHGLVGPGVELLMLLKELTGRPWKTRTDCCTDISKPHRCNLKQENAMDLYQEFHDMMQSSTEEEKEVLRLALQAIRQKRERGSAYPSGFLGLSGEFVEDGVYRFRVPITPYMMNRGGIVHGGVIGTLADSTMGSLINKS